MDGATGCFRGETKIHEKLKNFVSQKFLAIRYAEQKHLGCKKGEANQKQQLADYKYTHTVAILATKNFDIKVRPRIS